VLFVLLLAAIFGVGQRGGELTAAAPYHSRGYTVVKGALPPPSR
jgi:hypothetical protein